MKELLYIFFYFLYVFEFLVHFIKIKKWKEAYHEISFEKEAYAYEEYPNYPEIRNHYYWFKYW